MHRVNCKSALLKTEHYTNFFQKQNDILVNCLLADMSSFSLMKI